MVNLEALDLKAPPGAFSTWDQEVLVAELQKLKPGQVYVEVGVDKGKSLWIAREVAKAGVKIYGIDLRSDPGIKGVTFIQGDSKKVKWDKPIDVLFIDGDHTYKGCKGDIDKYSPYLVKGGAMLFHDCDESSPGVMRAVSEFVDEYKGVLRDFRVFKRTDKNTSMCLVRT